MRILCSVAVAACAVACPAENWPSWRGPEGTGVTNEKQLPTRWGTNQNVRWRIDLPSAGNSSPIVWGKKVFVAQALPKENRRTLMCFDRANGKLLWQAGVIYAERETTHDNNPFCSGTPVTDGKHVYACFGSAGVYAYDFDGKEIWHRDLGKLDHMFGNSVSPVLYEELCIVNYGPDSKARLIALKKKNGETVWEAEPPKPDEAEKAQALPGPGMFIAPQVLAQGDTNTDQKLSRDEFVALADSWYDKLDSDKAGKVTEQRLVDQLGELIPPPDSGSRDGARPPRRGPGPGGFIGPGFFTATDADKNGELTRDELKGTFGKWFVQWAGEESGTVDEGKLRTGFNSVLPRPEFGRPGGGGLSDPTGSWSTPLLIKTGGHDELIVNFPHRLVGYDPKTGKQLWMSKGIGGSIYTTPLWGEDTLVAVSSGAGTGNAIAVKPGGNGDVTEQRRLWRLDRVKGAIGSGVIRQGHFYTISSDGVAECMELATGKRIWEERLKGSGVRGGSWSSMLLAGDTIYVPNQSGDVFVLRASPKFEAPGCNSVSEPSNASLAASDGQIFMRTDKALWCFAEK